MRQRRVGPSGGGAAQSRPVEAAVTAVKKREEEWEGEERGEYESSI